MSTRSIIAITEAGDSGQWIYCHSNGFPEGPNGVGYKLLTFWQDAEDVRELMALGDLSWLGETIGVKVNFREAQTSSDKFGYQCLAYGRDAARRCWRPNQMYGGTDVFFTSDWRKTAGAEYAYLHTPDGWFATPCTDDLSNQVCRPLAYLVKP